jgi:hypothetical protein
MIKSNCVLAPSVMMQKRVFTFGKYNSSYKTEDYYMWLKILYNRGQIKNYSNIWAMYRFDNQITEEKIDWYNQGCMQAINDYSHVPSYNNAIKWHRFKYYVKKSFLIGRKQNVSSLDFSTTQKIVLFIIRLIPKWIRFYLFKRIMQKY